MTFTVASFDPSRGAECAPPVSMTIMTKTLSLLMK